MIGCCDNYLNVKKNIKVGDILKYGYKVIRIKPLKNGESRIDTEIWDEPNCVFKDPELLKVSFHTVTINP